MDKISREPFLWGVATSAFQLEGSPYADWTSWDSILDEKPNVTNHYHFTRKICLYLKTLELMPIGFLLNGAGYSQGKYLG